MSLNAEASKARQTRRPAGLHESFNISALKAQFLLEKQASGDSFVGISQASGQLARDLRRPDDELAYRYAQRKAVQLNTCIPPAFQRLIHPREGGSETVRLLEGELRQLIDGSLAVPVSK
jgi:hypothetical protein